MRAAHAAAAGGACGARRAHVCTAHVHTQAFPCHCACPAHLAIALQHLAGDLYTQRLCEGACRTQKQRSERLLLLAACNASHAPVSMRRPSRSQMHASCAFWPSAGVASPAMVWLLCWWLLCCERGLDSVAECLE